MLTNLVRPINEIHNSEIKLKGRIHRVRCLIDCVNLQAGCYNLYTEFKPRFH